MAGNFWTSSHYDQWIFEKHDLLRYRNEDLKIYSEEEYQKLMIFYANLIQTLALEFSSTSSSSSSGSAAPKTRMQVIATAIVYFKRFYARASFKDVDPFLIAVVSLLIASKTEEHGMMSLTKLIGLLPNCLRKWPSINYEGNAKSPGLYDAEFIMLETMDCCLFVYHPYTSLTAFLQDLQNQNVKDMDQIEAQCWKVANDTLRADCSLLYPPHIIAISAIIVGVELMNREKDIKNWLLELSLDYEKVHDCVVTIFTMYRVWKSFDEKEQVKPLFDKMPRVNPGPTPY